MGKPIETPYIVYFTMNTTVKDSKYRVIIDGFYTEVDGIAYPIDDYLVSYMIQKRNPTKIEKLQHETT